MIEYFENSGSVAQTNAATQNADQHDELAATGCYFIQYDVVQNKITGYFK